VVAIVGVDPGEFTSGSGLATLAVLFAAVLYAGSGVYARTLRGTSPVIMTWAQMSTSTVLLLPLVLIERPWNTATWSRESVLSTAILTLGTVTAYLLYFQILGRAGAVNASLVAYVIPVIAVLLGVTFLDERLEPRHVAGMALILAAMGLIDGRFVRWLASRRTTTSDLPAD
jgi:drug/metabolite transporter (DMT)-like permease